jgi:hypothetical protein
MALFDPLAPTTDAYLLKRIRAVTLFFIAALFISGITAIPLQPELDLLVRYFAQDQPPTALGRWLLQVQAALAEQNARWPFLALGTDWLAFGHIVIGLGFIGLLRDPVRNQWLITWGFLACLLVLPWAWGFGMLRGIPWGWRLIDCSFGIGGMVPLFLILRDVRELQRRRDKQVLL